MALSAGHLRHRIDLQKNVKTQDAQTGESADKWVTYKTIWARVEPLSVRDFISAQAAQSQVTARITIRRRSDIEPSHRIKYRGRLHKIVGILEDKESGLEYQTIMVNEGASIDGK